MKRALCTALAAALLAIGQPAFAQGADEPTAEDIKAAGQEFDLGRRAFKAKEWIEAAEHFESADARAPSAVALQLAISARERAGQLDRAATLAALALERHPDDKNLSKVADAVLKKSRSDLHEVAVTCDEPCDLVIDTKLVHGRAASSRTLFVAPGNYSLRAGWSHGRAERKPLEATAGGKSEVSFQAPPVPEEPAEKPAGVPPPGDQTPTTTTVVKIEPKGGWSPTVFWVGVGLTGVAGIASIWSGIDTLNNPGEDRVREECRGLGESCETYQEGLDNERRTNILLAVTGVLAVGTAVIGAFATDWGGGDETEETVKRRAPKRQVAVEPWLGVGSGATLGAQGRF